MGDSCVIERRRGTSKTYDLSPVEFRTVLRVRPLQKKEREDHVILEVQNNNKSKTCKLPSVVMRALPRTEHHTRAPFASPEQSRFDSHEEEFRFDAIFGERSSQDVDVFGQIGRPMSSAAMEPLFSDKQQKPQAFVNIAVGTCGSGKTYTCWGNTTQSLRKKHTSDGMIPRMTDSLFGQYHRLASLHSRTSKSCRFAVNISALQVNQPKNPKSHSSDAGKLYDLLQHLSSPKQSAQPINDFERNTSAESSTSVRSGPSTLSDRSGSSTNSSDDKVYIDQNPLTHDFRVVNAQIKPCRTSEDAREVLQEVTASIRKLSSKRNQSHAIIQLQPILIDRKSGSTKRQGSTIVFLDMAGSEDLATSRARHRAVSKRMKDTLPGRCDAHASVLHCLRSILFNEQLRQEKDLSHMATDSKHHPMTRDTSLKQVPYLQHKTTMLLQPSFSANRSGRTIVTMIMAASPSHRDYMEKRGLLHEIESLWKPLHRATVQACTGLSDKEEENRRCSSSGHRGKPCSMTTELPISLASSESTDDFSLPPPIAPPNPTLLPAQPLTHRASAPVEEDPYERTVIEMDRSIITDFPGVDIPAVQQGMKACKFHPTESPPQFCKESAGDVLVGSPPQLPVKTGKMHGKLIPIPYSGRKKKARARSRSRSPLRPTRDGNEYSRSFSEANINVPRKKMEGNVTDVPTKKKWSKKVETTTTVVETSCDAAIDSSPPQAEECKISGSQGEMEDLRRQNLSLQRELVRLRQNARKSVSWRDGRDKGVDCSPNQVINEKNGTYPSMSAPRSHHDRSAPGRRGSAPRTGRVMDTPVLRQQMAKHKTASSSLHKSGRRTSSVLF